MSTVLAQENATYEPMYRSVLGSEWNLVESSVQSAHLHGQVIRGQGSVEFRLGSNRCSKLIGNLLRLPPTGVHDAVVEVTRRKNGESWHRRFGKHGVTTEQEQIGFAKVRERFKLIEFDLEVTREGNGIRYRSRAAHMRIGALRIPLLSRLEPAIRATEMPENGGTRIDIKVFFPRDRMLDVVCWQI